jgi:hypothetical protein
MLIIDRHGSYLTIEFVTYCWDYKVSPFLLPAHSTHLLQPLDVGVFQAFKKYHQNVLDTAIRYGGLDFKHDDFLAAFQEMHDRTFKIGTIKSAFQKTGLYPFDPKLVLNKMTEFADPRPESVEPPSTPNHLQIPTKATLTTPVYMSQIAYLSDYIDQRTVQAISGKVPISPFLAKVIEKRNKGTNVIIMQGVLAQRELDRKYQAENEKARRWEGSDRHIQQYGTIYVGNGRLTAIARNQAEEASIEAIRVRKEKKMEEEEALYNMQVRWVLT